MSHPTFPTREELVTVAEKLSRHVHRTPLLRSSRLGALAGGTVYLKCENLQRTGSFKIRGAMNAVLSLTPSERERGVVTYSSGNHGQALALAGKLAGVRAVVCMPTNAPATKVEAARGYGAEVRFAGTSSKERKLAAEDAVAREGLVMVPPFDDPRVVAGQASIGFEIAEQCPTADIVICPAGGGGLLAGTSLALSFVLPRCAVYGVEPDTADAVARGIAHGAPVEIAPSSSIADGLLPVRAGALTVAIARNHVTSMFTVTDEELLAAMRFLMLSCKLVVEPSGAATVAALMTGKLPLEGRTAVAVLSGGNVEPDRLRSALE
jgi:threo-3-hydroxy-L-aspartate ammonia-lyase